MKKYKCNCENIPIGSYDNQVALQAPIWSQKNRISVDSCYPLKLDIYGFVAFGRLGVVVGIIN